LLPDEAKGFVLAFEARDQFLLDPLRSVFRSPFRSVFRGALPTALRSLVQARLQGIGKTFNRTGSFHVHSSISNSRYSSIMYVGPSLDLAF
jgi:hypothetical protein